MVDTLLGKLAPIAEKVGYAGLTLAVGVTAVSIARDIAAGDYQKAADSAGEFGTELLAGLAGGMATGATVAVVGGRLVGAALMANPIGIAVITAAGILASIPASQFGPALWDNVIKPELQAIVDTLYDVATLGTLSQTPEFQADYPVVAQMLSLGINFHDGIYKAASSIFAFAHHDPLVVDVSGSGIKIADLSPSSPYFDVAGNGHSQQTSWIGLGTGFLAIADSDGLVHNGTSLIASFDQLEAMDVKGRGVIDSSSPGFSQLVVWQDLNGDGLCQSNEVSTLASLGITSIQFDCFPKPRARSEATP